MQTQLTHPQDEIRKPLAMGVPGPGELPEPEEKDPQTHKAPLQDPEPKDPPLNAPTDPEIQKQGEIKTI